MNQTHSRRILLFIDSLLSGGAQRQLVVLANELSKRGHHVVILTYYDGDQLSQHLESSAIQVTCVRRHHRLDVTYLFRLQRHLRRVGPDCIISYLNTANFWARIAGRLAGVPAVITSVRNISVDHRRGTALIEKLLSRWSTAIVANAHSVRQKLIELHVPDNKITVIYNAIDTRTFHRAPEEEITTLRQSLGIGQHERMLLLPGRISRQKNHHLLVDAVLSILVSGLPIRTVFAGNEFDQRIAFEIRQKISLAGHSDRFVFLGPRRDMPSLYSAADCVVLPSLWEGLPNAVLESMACGTPVVASDVSDNRHLIDHGKTGYLFPSDDLPALKKAITDVLALPRDDLRAMGEQAAKAIVEKCSLSRFGNQYASLIEVACPRMHGIHH